MKYDKEYFLGEHECEEGCPCECYRHPDLYIDDKGNWRSSLFSMYEANKNEIVPHRLFLDENGKYNIELAENETNPMTKAFSISKEKAVEWNSKDITEKKYFDGNNVKPMTEYIYIKRSTISDEDIEKLLKEL
ncbi:TPA: hypothetical protein R2K44_001397 [Raoultella ornithinolytica]|nr:hypothetical protein [Raoultella ornithinolytica]